MSILASHTFDQPGPLKRAPSSEEMRHLGQILSLLHTSPPRTVFADQDRAWRAVAAARELHRRILWGAPRKADGSTTKTAYQCVDTAIQLITVLLDAAERMRRDGQMDQAAALLDEALRYARSTRLLVPFIRSDAPQPEMDERALAMSRLFKAEAETCMRFALILIPARDLNGELIGLVGAYSLAQDAAASCLQSNSNDWQASQMIGMVRDAIYTALSWQSRQERIAASILDGICYRAVYDEQGNALEQPTEIKVRRPIAADAAELEAKLSARNDLSVRFGNLGEASGDAEDDAMLPPGAGVMFQCWLPCVEAYVTEHGRVRLRCPDSAPDEYMTHELSVGAAGESRQLDLVRLETSGELHAVLRMLANNLAAAGVSDTASEHCLPALRSLFRIALSDAQPAVPADER
jgi:hypothetical protein